MKISFVIPAHNEEALLPRTLAALKLAGQQSGHEFEIVVADDASTDRTAEIAAALGAKVVSIDRRQIAAARNAGWRFSGGDALIFVDADTAPEPACVREAIAALNAGAVGGGGSVRVDGQVPFTARVLMPILTGLFRLLSLTGGCFFFCTRQALERAGGWDESVFAGEEIYLAKAMKKQGRFVIVRTPVLTSGRKLRTHTTREIFAPLLWSFITFGRTLRKREGLEMWYGPRRDDPADQSDLDSPTRAR